MSEIHTKNKYPDYIMEHLRQRQKLEPDDKSLDGELSKLTNNEVFSEVLHWRGLLGNWDTIIKNYVLNIYGVDLDKHSM